MDRIKYIQRMIRRANMFMVENPEKFKHKEKEEKEIVLQPMGKKKEGK